MSSAVLTLATLAALVTIAALHLHWALGGRWGLRAAIPEKDGQPLFVPRPPSTLAAAAFLLLAAALVAMHAGWLQPRGPRSLSRDATWCLAAIFALRAVGEFRYVGLFKRVRGTRFARYDTLLYSPLCLLLALALLWLARRP